MIKKGQTVESIKGKTIEETREEARAALAKYLLTAMAILIGVTVFVGGYLLYSLPNDKFSTKDLLNLILGVGSLFSGLLGAAITYYFSNAQKVS